MPHAEQQPIAADPCATGSPPSELQSPPSSVTEECASAKASPSTGNSSPGAGKTSKRFVDEDSKSPEYRSDTWRMANFKVVPCSKRYAHDWTICPFAHPGEKARRRDPRIYKYAGIACPEMKKAGFCSRGDKCPYAHNVFEFWLHPTRYRTQLCNDGVNCTRNVCFFAHTVEEMRPAPCKLSDTKREIGKGGAVSPDTPFLQPGGSLMTTSSTCSSDAWHMLSPEDRARSTSYLPDELQLSKAPKTVANNELIDDLASSLANVKLAMTGHKREEVITMLSKLLQEANEDKEAAHGRPPAQHCQTSAPASHNHAAELSLALSSLDRSQTRSLLGDTNRRNLMASQLANSAPDAGQDWRHIVHQILEGSQDAPRGQTPTHPPAGSDTLLTAPAALDPISRSGDFGIDFGNHMAPRVLSADLNLLQQHTYWQNPGLHELHQMQRELSQRCNGHMMRGFSGDIDTASHQLPPYAMLDDKLYGSGPQLPLAANPNALRKQSLNLDDIPHLPKPQPPPRREVRRPPISAFQSAATQDWKQPVGRASATDLRWANSGGRMSSSDLMTINEGAPPYKHTDPFQCPQLENATKLPFGLDRSQSTGVGGEPPVLNILPAPLAFPSSQPGGRDTSALHSAPYDLSLAYSSDRDATCARQSFDHQVALQRQSLDHQAAMQRQSFDHAAVLQRQSFDHQPALHGWGGLQPADFSLTRF